MSRPPRISPDASPVAHEIYRRMVECGYNQRSLSLAAGLGATYIRDLFVGASQNPKSEQLYRVARTLGCSVEELTAPGGDASEQQSDNVVEFSNLGQLRGSEPALIRMWRLLGDGAKMRALDYIASLIEPGGNRKSDNG
jgi:hypothetical protein